MPRGITKEDNFIWLLLSLVLLMFSSALFAQLHLNFIRVIINITLMITINVAVWSMRSRDANRFRSKLFVSVVVAVLMIAASLAQHELLDAILLFFILGFLIYTIHTAWQQVMFTGDITPNKIVGAICIYILIGLLFAVCFLLTEYYWPGSLRGLNSGVWQENLGVVVSYSMVTLTTLGYGDVVPAAPMTRFLAYLEAIVGIFYTTVLVASLIGMQLSSYRAGPRQ